jgi:hypothetical protein
MKQTALQRIKEIEVRSKVNPSGTWNDLDHIAMWGEGPKDREFLLKAFNVMREIASIAWDESATTEQVKKLIDEEFEERMSK